MNGAEFLNSNSVNEILTRRADGDVESYRHFCTVVKDYKKLPESTILNLFARLRACVGYLNNDTKDLNSIILDVDWFSISDEVLNEHAQFLVTLAVGQVTCLELVLRCIVKKFIPVLPPNEIRSVDSLDADCSQSFSRVYTIAHSSINSIIRISPMSVRKLTGVLADCFPFMRRHPVQIRDYVRNLLVTYEYAHDVQVEILRLIVAELVRIDTICHKESVAGTDENKSIFNPGQSNDTFFMEVDADEFQKAKSKLDDFSHKMDLVLCDLFAFIDQKNATSGSIAKVYRYFLEVFERVVLPVYKCNHVQYLWFFMCQQNQNVCSRFLNWLWCKIQDPSTVEVLRQMAACYLACFLARANFVSTDQCYQYISLFVDFVQQYARNNDAVYVSESVVKHATFYSLCQATFYVIIARLKEFIKAPKGHEFLKNLRLDRLVTCSLNPLRYCTESVVESFAAASRNYQFAFCYGIIERNRRTDFYEILNNASSGYTSYSTFERNSDKRHHNNMLHWFFPFEPCTLPQCLSYVKSGYRNFSDKNEEFHHKLDEMTARQYRHSASRTRNESQTTTFGSFNDYEFLSAEDVSGSVGSSTMDQFLPSVSSKKSSK